MHSQYSGPSLKGHYLERTPPCKGHNFLQQVLWMHVVLPLTKGHLSNKDRIIWQKGCPYLRGMGTCYQEFVSFLSRMSFKRGTTVQEVCDLTYSETSPYDHLPAVPKEDYQCLSRLRNKTTSQVRLLDNNPVGGLNPEVPPYYLYSVLDSIMRSDYMICKRYTCG